MILIFLFGQREGWLPWLILIGGEVESGLDMVDVGEMPAMGLSLHKRVYTVLKTAIALLHC